MNLTHAGHWVPARPVLGIRATAARMRAPDPSGTGAGVPGAQCPASEDLTVTPSPGMPHLTARPEPLLPHFLAHSRNESMGKQAAVVLYVLALVAVVVGVDVVFFRNRFWERLIVNVGIVLVFAAFYLRFLKPP